MYRAILILTFVAVSNAVPLLLQELEQGQQFELTPVLNRQRREPQQWFGGGGANGQSQHFNLGLKNPNGSGGQIGYGHNRGWGHDVSVDAMVPVWSKQSKLGESTLNLGGGVSQHFGGPLGNQMTDKRIGATFVHRF